MTHDGWIQRTVALSGTGQLSAEVEGWVADLTEFQKNPVDDHPDPFSPDLNHDGVVNVDDLVLLIVNWNGKQLGGHQRRLRRRRERPGRADHELGAGGRLSVTWSRTP